MKTEDRIAVPIRKAAVMMLENGFSIENVQEFVKAVAQPVAGYVYVDEIPLRSEP